MAEEPFPIIGVIYKHTFQGFGDAARNEKSIVVKTDGSSE